jgi:hypothetical protein
MRPPDRIFRHPADFWDGGQSKPRHRGKFGTAFHRACATLKARLRYTEGNLRYTEGKLQPGQSLSGQSFSGGSP